MDETTEALTRFAVDADGFGHVWLRFEREVVAMQLTPAMARQLALALRRKADEAARAAGSN